MLPNEAAVPNRDFGRSKPASGSPSATRGGHATDAEEIKAEWPLPGSNRVLAVRLYNRFLGTWRHKIRNHK